jgi:hypothetical protein
MGPMRRVRTLMTVAILASGALACQPAAAPVSPAVDPQVVCQGVPDVVCKDASNSTSVGGGSVAQILVRCTASVCTEETGEAAITVTFLDGRQEQSGYGWSGAEPGPAQPIPVITPPTLAVQPVCQGVPRERCLEMATTGLNGASADTVTSITVHCDTTCTLANGQGQTKYEYAPGAPSTTASWVYGN